MMIKTAVMVNITLQRQSGCAKKNIGQDKEYVDISIPVKHARNLRTYSKLSHLEIGAS